jgi:hypothetical protein
MARKNSVAPARRGVVRVTFSKPTAEDCAAMRQVRAELGIPDDTELSRYRATPAQPGRRWRGFRLDLYGTPRDTDPGGFRSRLRRPETGAEHFLQIWSARIYLDGSTAFGEVRCHPELGQQEYVRSNTGLMQDVSDRDCARIRRALERMRGPAGDWFRGAPPLEERGDDDWLHVAREGRDLLRAGVKIKDTIDRLGLIDDDDLLDDPEQNRKLYASTAKTLKRRIKRLEEIEAPH